MVVMVLVWTTVTKLKDMIKTELIIRSQYIAGQFVIQLQCYCFAWQIVSVSEQPTSLNFYANTAK